MASGIVELTRDQLDNLDPDIVGVEYNKELCNLRVRLAFSEIMYFTEQDLVTLLNFIRTNQQEKV